MSNYLREAIEVLLGNRLRTVLSLLGLIVGVAAVITIQVLGTATAGAMAGVVQGLSEHSFLVFPNTQGGFDRKMGFKLSEVNAVAALPNVLGAIPFSNRTSTVTFGHQRVQLTVAPTGAGTLYLPQKLAEGRAITPGEVAEAARVCVLSSSAATKLEPAGADILGREIRIGSFHCRVVGVQQKPPSGALNFNFAPDVAIPYTSFVREYLRGQTIFAMQIVVANLGRIAQTEDTVKGMLSQLKNGKYRYNSFDNRSIASQIGGFFTVLTTIVGMIGAISLVVAGIGIMNILLVSIVERTREIGVRKAIGARRRQIMGQFFLEASLIAGAGCAVGVIAGLLAGWFVNTHYIIKISGVIVPLPWIQAVVLAVVFAVLITLAFGTYPAYRAAGLDPIEALRYE